MRLRGLVLTAIACGIVIAGVLTLVLPDGAARGGSVIAAGDPLGAASAAGARTGSPPIVAAGWPQRRTWRIDGAPRTVAREVDPGGGPDWAVRVFPARQTWRETNGARRFGTPLGCVQLGRVYERRFGWIDGRNVFRPVAPGPGGTPTNCSALPSDPRFTRTIEWLTRISDPADGPVRPLGTVAWSVFDADPDHPRVRLRLGADAARAAAGVEYRTPDPSGGLPWGLAETAAAGHPACVSWPGRVVGDRVGRIDYRLGTLSESRWGGRPSCATSSSGGPVVTTRRPLALATASSPSADPDPGLAARRIARRTLQGSTTISGIAHRDVVAVTLASPRDVRTLTPSPREHAFAAVYDGDFPTGAIEVTARMRDGTTHRVSAGPFQP